MTDLWVLLLAMFAMFCVGFITGAIWEAGA